MWKAVFALVLCGLSGMATAQEQARIDTPSGPAVITREGIDTVISVGGQGFRFEGMPYAGFAEAFGDVHLLYLASGGTACPSMFVWLDPRPGVIRVSDVFGTCSDMYELSWDAASVTVSMPSLVPGEGMVDFIWDGAGPSLRQVARGHDPSGIAPGAVLSGWDGRWGAELLAAPDWRAVLVALMGEAALLDAQRIVQVGSPFAIQGDWLVSAGCQPHACDVTAGAVALRPADGALIVALWEQGVGLRVFGDTAAGVPPGVAEVMAR